MKITNNLHVFLWESLTQNNCNTYLIDGPTRILIDPGHAALFQHVEQGLSELNLKLSDIGLVICTHAHPDHIEAIKQLKGTEALLALHVKEWELVRSMKHYISAFGMKLDDVMPDFFLKEGELVVNGTNLMILHTPGHSPGSINIYMPENKTLITGDVIFKESVGRTDLPGGSSRQLKDSILRLSQLDINYLLPGHGDIMTDIDEIQANFDFMARYL